MPTTAGNIVPRRSPGNWFHGSICAECIYALCFSAAPLSGSPQQQKYAERGRICSPQNQHPRAHSSCLSGRGASWRGQERRLAPPPPLVGRGFQFASVNRLIQPTLTRFGLISSVLRFNAKINTITLAQAWDNYGQGVICSPLSFFIQPAELKEAILIGSKS